MKKKIDNIVVSCIIVLVLSFLPVSATLAAKKLVTVPAKNWTEHAVRRVLKVFAYGGLADEGQIQAWAAMSPESAIEQMLTFDVNNELLSPTEDALADHCGSLQELQEFLGSADSENPLANGSRSYFTPLDSRSELSLLNLQRTYTNAVTTRGCNPFLLKMAFYLTNYHGAIHERNAGHALIRQYFDDYMDVLSSGANMVEILTAGASHAAVARAYRHHYNIINEDGTLNGNEDFAREYFQLFMGIPGTTIDQEYYEAVTIKNNGRLLTAMRVDRQPGLYGSTSINDHYFGPIEYSNHYDGYGQWIGNIYHHYESDQGANSCLEILETDICGANAGEKLDALGYVAAAHPESMDNLPVSIIAFFAEDNLDKTRIAKLRGSWAIFNYDLLVFIRQYAISKAFHRRGRIKYMTAFDRNLFIQNTNVLSNQEIYSAVYWRTAHDRMRRQGMLIFEPVKSVFGHQTGIDAANNPYIFRDGFFENWFDPGSLADSQRTYTATDGTSKQWIKNWGTVVPVSDDGDHVVGEVATFLWNRFITDGGRNFDTIARAQVQAILAEGVDFALSVDPTEQDPNRLYSTAEINLRKSPANLKNKANAKVILDLSDPDINRRIGLAVNFISMTPYAFAMEGR